MTALPSSVSVIAAPRARDQRALTALRYGTIATAAWGVFAFGGVYPWAYWPLAGAALVCGIAGLAWRPTASVETSSVQTKAACALLVAAIAVQLVPLPIAWLRTASPVRLSLLQQLDPAVAANLIRVHPLSIFPAGTWTGVALLACFLVLFLGTSRLLAWTGARRWVEALIVVGVVLALVGLAQKPSHSGKIYGFWLPESGRHPFGPFVNRNHFAGAMLLVVPLTLALLCAGVSRIARDTRIRNWRDRVLWLSSPDANRLLLIGAAAGLMTLSLLMTMSRSGMGALALSLAVIAWFVVRGQASRVRKATVGAYFVLLLALTVGWVGADAIVARFSSTDWGEFDNRLGAWQDARDIVARFPIAGTGYNTYGTATLIYQRHDLTQHYEQAHDDYLQLAAEGGVLVCLPALLLIVLFASDVRRRFKDDETGSTAWWLRVGAVTALLAMALQETVEFSLQMPGNAVLFAIVCAIAVHRAPVRAARSAS
ncbi:MAG TPA: O-antigen ligase family protein [Vicinamibacterales bacterium]|nr:O-antigen ligase family protein [Vicinamibacterales bacterium]